MISNAFSRQLKNAISFSPSVCPSCTKVGGMERIGRKEDCPPPHQNAYKCALSKLLFKLLIIILAVLGVRHHCRILMMIN